MVPWYFLLPPSSRRVPKSITVSQISIQVYRLNKFRAETFDPGHKCLVAQESVDTKCLDGLGRVQGGSPAGCGAAPRGAKIANLVSICTKNPAFETPLEHYSCTYMI